MVIRLDVAGLCITWDFCHTLHVCAFSSAFTENSPLADNTDALTVKINDNVGRGTLNLQEDGEYYKKLFDLAWPGLVWHNLA